jgi:flagellin
MLGGTDISSRLSSIYNDTSKQLSESLTRLASGKRINKASDDFSGYVKAANLTVDIENASRVKQRTNEVKGGFEFAVQAAQNVMEDIGKLKQLTQDYAAESDADAKELISQEFTAVKTSLTNLISNSKWNGSQVMSTAAVDVGSVAIDPSTTGTTTFSLSDFSTANTAVSGFDITSSTDADFQDATEAVAGYVASAESTITELDRYAKLADVISSSKQATRSMITDIDEAKELTHNTDLQIRSQASVAMMAQANSSRMGIMQLYM